MLFRGKRGESNALQLSPLSGGSSPSGATTGLWMSQRMEPMVAELSKDDLSNFVLQSSPESAEEAAGQLLLAKVWSVHVNLHLGASLDVQDVIRRLLAGRLCIRNDADLSVQEDLHPPTSYLHQNHLKSDSTEESSISVHPKMCE